MRGEILCKHTVYCIRVWSGRSPKIARRAAETSGISDDLIQFSPLTIKENLKYPAISFVIIKLFLLFIPTTRVGGLQQEFRSRSFLDNIMCENAQLVLAVSEKDISLL